MIAAVICSGSDDCQETIIAEVSTVEEADKFCVQNRNWVCEKHKGE